MLLTFQYTLGEEEYFSPRERSTVCKFAKKQSQSCADFVHADHTLCIQGLPGHPREEIQRYNPQACIHLCKLQRDIQKVLTGKECLRKTAEKKINLTTTLISGFLY